MGHHVFCGVGCTKIFRPARLPHSQSSGLRGQTYVAAFFESTVIGVSGLPTSSAPSPEYMREKEKENSILSLLGPKVPSQSVSSPHFRIVFVFFFFLMKHLLFLAACGGKQVLCMLFKFLINIDNCPCFS